jgi:hypothetical protein
MFFAVCDFAALYRAALCAAGIGVRAAVAAEQRDNRGVTPTSLPPSSPQALSRGGRSRPTCVSQLSARTALVAVIRRERLRVLSAAPTELTRLSGFAGNLRSSG